MAYGFPVFSVYKPKHKINAHKHTNIDKKECMDRTHSAGQLRVLSCKYNTNIKK